MESQFVQIGFVMLIGVFIELHILIN